MWGRGYAESSIWGKAKYMSLKDSCLGALSERSFMRDPGIPSTYSLVPSPPSFPFPPRL